MLCGSDLFDVKLNEKKKLNQKPNIKLIDIITNPVTKIWYYCVIVTEWGVFVVWGDK